MKWNKQIIVLISMALMLIATVKTTAQTGIFRDFSLAVPDTIVGADTIYYEVLGADRNAGDWPLSWDFSVVIQNDQISGTNTGTLRLEVSNTPPGETAVWSTLTTFTTASADFTDEYDNALRYRRIRFAYLKSGTGTNAIQYWAVFKKTSNRL